MMRKLSLAAALVIALCLPAAAQPSTAVLVDSAIELSGVAPVLESFPEQLSAMEQQRQMVSEAPETEARVYQALLDAYDVVQARQLLFDYLLQNADPATLKAAVATLETPLLRRITAEEVAASAGQASGDLLRYLGDLQSAPPTQERIGLIRQIVETAHMSETAVDLALTVVAGVQEALNQTLPEEKRKNPEELAEMLDNLRPALAKGLQQQMIYGSFYTYRNLSDDELEGYIAYLSGEVGQGFTAVMSKGLVHVFAESFAGAAEELAELATEARRGKCDQ